MGRESGRRIVRSGLHLHPGMVAIIFSMCFSLASTSIMCVESSSTVNFGVARIRFTSDAGLGPVPVKRRMYLPMVPG